MTAEDRTEEANTETREEAQQPQGQQFDPEKLQAVVTRLRSEQNLLFAVLAGIVGAILSAGAWAAVTVASGYQIGFMAIAVGAVVGVLVRVAGKGLDKQYGVIGAVLALIGCGLGNLLAVTGIMAQEFGLPFQEMLLSLDFGLAVEMMKATFSGMDVLFYGLAVYTGYRLSFRKLGQDDLAEAIAVPE